jgi:phosphate acetyltransferase
MSAASGRGLKILDDMKEKARAKKRTVVYPEGNEPRIIKAAKIVVEQKIASVIILGKIDEVAKLAKAEGLNLDSVKVIDPAQSELLPSFAKELYELRKTKGLSEKEAAEIMKGVLFFGAMLVRKDMADGCVAGSINTTGDVMRAGIQVIGLAPGIKVVSSCFIMTIPKYRDTENKIFIFADSAVVPNPDPEQLASIAASSAKTMKNLVGEEPWVAMLSFSTKGSAKHADVDKVLAALEIIKKNYPDLKADGEFQLDAAIVPEVAKSKAPKSEIAGNANVLIFPDLDAGNIGYKLVQRLAGATATGPVIQGLNKPMNDLSRGCSVDDVVDVTAIAMLMKG